MSRSVVARAVARSLLPWRGDPRATSSETDSAQRGQLSIVGLLHQGTISFEHSRGHFAVVPTQKLDQFTERSDR